MVAPSRMSRQQAAPAESRNTRPVRPITRMYEPKEQKVHRDGGRRAIGASLARVSGTRPGHFPTTVNLCCCQTSEVKFH